MMSAGSSGPYGAPMGSACGTACGMACGPGKSVVSMAVGDPTEALRAFVGRVQRLALVVLICVAVWAATGGAFWPAWVMLGAGLMLVKHAYHTFVAPTDAEVTT